MVRVSEVRRFAVRTLYPPSEKRWLTIYDKKYYRYTIPGASRKAVPHIIAHYVKVIFVRCNRIPNRRQSARRPIEKTSLIGAQSALGL